MIPEIEYIGEHLLPGYLGQFCVVLSFVAALFSAWAYRCATKQSESSRSWARLGRVSYVVHGLSTFIIIGVLFYIMLSQYYEYTYVQAHVNEELPMRYIFSAFWEGQEGSFLLWMFWHIILGFILIKKAGDWEASVMIFVALIQAVLASMLLGIHIEIGEFSYKLGSNPTLLLRDMMDIPLFQSADYVSAIKGTGLNALLQNYWMTIHPPTLFLGFASTTIPFAFAAAGLYTGRVTEWIVPAKKWALFSAGILGVGILMGSAWAYEALSFGGYWAWDPVENMSLVPWIILVAGVHTNLIANATGRAIRSTFIYYSLCFVGVLYSTYLTRSGILGDTSVHAFTEMGLEVQLIFMVAFFLFLSIGLYISKSRLIPKFAKEESIYSREFWMFVGALVLLFSGTIIAGSTSLPVLNAIINLKDPDFIGTVITDEIAHFNKFQIWIAVLVTTLSAIGIFLRYKIQEFSKQQKVRFVATQLIHLAVAALLTFVLSLWIDYYHWKYIVMAFTAWMAVVSNAHYLIKVAKNSPKLVAAAVSHIGFAVMIIGVLTSSLNQDYLTSDPFVTRGLMGKDDPGTTIPLIKEEPLFVNNHWFTYESDTIIDKTRTFKIKIEKEDPVRGNIDPYYVYPNVLFTNDLSKIAANNPGTKHFLSKDIFTTIAALPVSQQDVKLAKEEEDSLVYKQYLLNIGDTIFTKEHYGILESVNFSPTNKDYLQQENDLGLSAKLRFRSLDGKYDEVAEPAIGVRENLLYQYHDQLNDLKLKLKLHEQSFDNYFKTEDQLTYDSFVMKKEDKVSYGGEEFILIGFDNVITNKHYKEKENDIKVQAVLRSAKGIHLKPTYVIREGRPFNLKDYTPEAGIHARLVHINPKDEEFTFAFAQDDRTSSEIVLDLAEDVPRSDFIALEAIIFPGINLFWAGSIMMLMGFFISLLSKTRR